MRRRLRRLAARMAGRRTDPGADVVRDGAHCEVDRCGIHSVSSWRAQRQDYAAPSTDGDIAPRLEREAGGRPCGCAGVQVCWRRAAPPRPSKQRSYALMASTVPSTPGM